MGHRKRFISLLLLTILILAVVQLTAAQSSAGPVIGPGHHLYQHFDIYLSWHEARDFCQTQGGHLVTINSQEENDFVYQFFPYGWLGATDELSEGTWLWVTGEPWSYTNWAPGEPNNCCPPEYCGGSGCTPEHYLTFWGEPYTAQWNDVPNGRSRFICEWDVQIDVKPGSYPNSINLGARGVVPVAILTSEALDATTVDPVSVLFADAAPLRWAYEDVDYDGDDDLVFHFKILELNLTDASTVAILTGQTFGGQPFMAADTVNIVPAN